MTSPPALLMRSIHFTPRRLGRVAVGFLATPCARRALPRCTNTFSTAATTSQWRPRQSTRVRRTVRLRMKTMLTTTTLPVARPTLFLQWSRYRRRADSSRWRITSARTWRLTRSQNPLRVTRTIWSTSSSPDSRTRAIACHLRSTRRWSPACVTGKWPSSSLRPLTSSLDFLAHGRWQANPSASW